MVTGLHYDKGNAIQPTFNNTRYKLKLRMSHKLKDLQQVLEQGKIFTDTFPKTFHPPRPPVTNAPLSP